MQLRWIFLIPAIIGLVVAALARSERRRLNDEAMRDLILREPRRPQCQEGSMGKM